MTTIQLIACVGMIAGLFMVLEITPAEMSDSIFSRLTAAPGSIRTAALTGCKNIAKAKKVGEYEVEVPEWGVRLNTAQPVGDGVVAVGIRAHYFNVKSTRNRYPIVYAGEMEEPFEWTVRFRFAGQDETSEALWWRVTKDKRPQEFPKEFGVAPSNILLLYA